MPKPDERAAEEREAVERDIRAHCEGGRLDRAAALLLETYGREIFRFTMSRLRDEDATSEVFSEFAENLWRSLGGFKWQCTARVWSYTLARHAMSRHIEDVRKRRARTVPLSEAGPLSEIGQKIRTETLAAMRTETKTIFAELREELPIDDQTLILLRVGRGLSWKEIARILFETQDGSEPLDRELNQASARLRQRFQVVKDKLRQMARDRGVAIDQNDS
jgi:RNA polymerase sigma-70 factor (ECF subfamily)